MILCDYGCEQEAKFTFKNKKHCCNKNLASCPFIKSINSFLHKGKINRKKGKTYIELYGEERAKLLKENHSKKVKGQKAWNKGKTGVYRREVLENWSRKRIGRKLHTEETKKRYRDEMLNGKAAYLNSLVKDNSKPENKLFILLCKILPKPIHKCPIYRVGKGRRSYNADISDFSLGIIIEYDGWHHFNIPGRKEYDIKRQIELEKEGWKVLRYNIYQKFPTFDEVKKDVMNLLSNKNSE